jgi:hypothetical protein
MNLRSFFISIVAGTLLAGCAAGSGVPDREGLVPTESDMRRMVNDIEPILPYSRYIYRITGKDGSRVSEGIISMSPAAEQDLRLVVEGSKLRAIANSAFLNTHDIMLGDSDVSTFAGGNFWGERLTVVPGFSKPVEFLPEWFPEGMLMSIDRECNLLVRSKNPHMSEIQKLVVFIDVRTRFNGVRCKLLGTFQTFLELQRIVKDSRAHAKGDGGQNYVLRLDFGDTFALVRLMRKDER